MFWLMVQPLSLAVLLLVLGLALSWFRRRWVSRTLIGLALLILFLCCFTSFGYLAIGPLENRFVRPAEPANVDGIVVLGGPMDADVYSARGGWELTRSGDRYVETVRLAQKYPTAKVVIAAGPGALEPDLEPEALAAQRMLADFGISGERVILDQRSRNTEENAQFAKELAGATEGQTWLLVTSAFHMPRSVGLFRRAGFAVVPWPTDYLSSGIDGIELKFDQPVRNVDVATVALREWTGLAGYYSVGKIDEILPGP